MPGPWFDRRGAKLTVYDDKGNELWDHTVRPRVDDE